MSNALQSVANAMMAKGKGILATDESTGTINKRFASINTESTATSRRNYREMLFRSKPAMSEHISGVILYDETIRQNAKDGTPLIQVINDAGAIPGIKVDTGAKDLAGSLGEKITEGLDGLRERLNDYYELGARFAKWRAVLNIGDHMPSRHCLNANAQALARYAALCQQANIVPIIEPEVIMDGPHSIERCFDVTEATLTTLYEALREHRVLLEGSILKPNMVVSGTGHADQASIDEVAEKTVQCLKRTVPAAVPGIVFLSGGQSDIAATAHLSAMNAGFDTPWQLSFSYGRALQAAALKTWAGQEQNLSRAAAAFTHRARMNGLAAQGKWSPDLERRAA